MFELAPHEYRELASQPMSERLQLVVLCANHYGRELTKLLNFFDVDTTYRKWAKDESAPFVFSEALPLDDPEFVEKFLKRRGLTKTDRIDLTDIFELVQELRRSTLLFIRNR